MSTEPFRSDPDKAGIGGVNASLSRAVVGIMREYVGRGPTKARTSIEHDTVVVMMSDTLTKGERNLVAAGMEEQVRAMRRTFQESMRGALVAAVEEITGRRVLAFMSDNHIDPDLACEVFVLERAAHHEP